MPSLKLAESSSTRKISEGESPSVTDVYGFKEKRVWGGLGFLSDTMNRSMGRLPSAPEGAGPADASARADGTARWQLY